LELVELIKITHYVTGYTTFSHPFTQKKEKVNRPPRAMMPSAEHHTEPCSPSPSRCIMWPPQWLAACAAAAESRRLATAARGLRRRRGSRPALPPGLMAAAAWKR